VAQSAIAAPVATSGFTTSPAGPDLSRFLEASEPHEGDDEPEEEQRLRRARFRRRMVRLGLRIVIVAAIAITATILLRTYVVDTYYIPSASMEPTLHGCPGCNDDHVLVDKLSYRTHDPHQGDIVVFHRPPAWQAVPDKTLIKRVVAVGGDRVRLTDGHVYVDNVLLDETYVNKACGAHPTQPEATDPTTGKLITSWVVPDNDVFVMGDNRCDSEDSRMYGPVPNSSIVGRAFMIIWPVHRIGTI
jgi:signal peptidase I